MPVITNALGIHQSDLIIRTAIEAGLHELRVLPYLLDYCFASVPKDALTARDFGEKDVVAAKKWFLATEIPVVFGKRIGEAVFPCVTVSLFKSTEIKNTLSDTNYEVREDKVEGWPDLTAPFAPKSYNRITGELFLPSTVLTSLVVVKGQLVVSQTGKPFPILDVGSSGTSVFIDTGIREELSQITIRGAKPPTIVTLGSARFSENYAIGVHTIGEPVFLTWLHSIVVFVLLRRRPDLLEGRGLECTSLDSTDVKVGQYFEGSTEIINSRFVMLTGEVLQWWPEQEQPRAQDAMVQGRVVGAGKSSPAPGADDSVVGDEDPDGDFFFRVRA